MRNLELLLAKPAVILLCEAGKFGRRGALPNWTGNEQGGRRVAPRLSLYPCPG